jgi:hypothetical protein
MILYPKLDMAAYDLFLLEYFYACVVKASLKEAPQHKNLGLAPLKMPGAALFFNG